MDVTGAFTCGEFSVSSDIRIKENIQKIENILQKINQIRGVSYNLRIDKYKKNALNYYYCIQRLYFEYVISDCIKRVFLQ